MAARAATLYFISLTLSACSSLNSGPPAPETGLDGAACMGQATISSPGLAEADNQALQRQAQFATDKGGLCAAKVLSVTEPVVLYRVYDAGRPYSKFGGWWSLARPSGTKDDYRSAYAICPEWSDLNRLVSCQIRPGSLVVIGTTQSAICQDGKVYPKTEKQQVYVANDSRAGIYHVGACSDEAMIWQ